VAKAEQIKALLKSHLEGDDQRFFAVAMQVAAHEARLGHAQLAVDIRSLVDKAKAQRGAGRLVQISQPRGELANLLAVSYPKARLSAMVLSEDLAREIRRVIREQRHAEKILSHGLSPRRKLLLLGPPGTGKTLTASVLAGELGLPLFQVRLDGLLTKFMGETAAKLRQVFEATDQTRGVYFFDEFDAIGSQRSASNDVGEIRRVLNSFLLMIEQDQSHSLILAATNHPDILDTALFRRFDDVLSYALPDTKQIEKLLRARLERVTSRGVRWSELAAESIGLSYAEIARAVEEVLKSALIEGTEEIGEADILRMLKERKEIRRRVRSSQPGPGGDQKV
jgi:SpoVK/Ycf46/Vps4 family AAA+-type ATPase